MEKLTSSQDMDVSGRRNGRLTLTRTEGKRIVCTVLTEKIEDFLTDQKWGEELTLYISLSEIRGQQARIAIQAARAVKIVRAEIDEYLGEWQASDGLTMELEVNEEILLAYSRETLVEVARHKDAEDPLDLLDLRVEKIGEDRIKVRLGTEIRNLRFARHCEVPSEDDFEEDQSVVQ